MSSMHFAVCGKRSETSMPLWNLVTVVGSRLTRVEEFSDEADARDAARL